MVIAAITPYAINLILDKQQALVIMEALNFMADCPLHHELEHRMAEHGQHFTDGGVNGHILQAIDILSKATGRVPYVDEEQQGDQVEEDGLQEEEDAEQVKAKIIN